MAYDLIFDVQYKNRDIKFVPAGGKLVGEIRHEDISTDKVPGKLNKVGGVIPGYQLRIDTKSGKAEIVDKLNTPDCSELLESIRKVEAGDEAFPQRLGEKIRRWGNNGVVREGTHDLGSSPPNNIATWLWHAKRLVDMGRLHVVKGSLPGYDDIRKLGPVYLGGDGGITNTRDKSPHNILAQLPVKGSRDKDPVAAG